MKPPNSKTKKLLEIPFTIVLFLLLTFLLICSFFYFDYGVLINGVGPPMWTFRVSDGGGGGGGGGGECDYSDGKWVYDESYPLYDSRDCLFADGGFKCLKNYRPDSDFTKWRWQPNQCDLPRFDAKLMLEKLRNKRVAFIGDSIGRNQWESLLCMLSSVVSDKASIYEVNGNPITKHMGYLVFRFRDYNCTIEYYRAPFLVVQGRPPAGSPGNVRYALRVDQLDWTCSRWKDADVLIFNAGHWWSQDKTVKSGTFFQEGKEVKMNMTVGTAFRRSIETLADFIDSHVNSNKTSVYFRSYAPIHFSGGDWKQGGTCHLETKPNLKAPYLPKTWDHYNAVKDVLLNHANVNMLDVTYMSLQRKDAHPSLYYMNVSVPMHRQDCSHWCLPGVPDNWNELLYAVFLRRHPLQSES